MSGEADPAEGDEVMVWSEQGRLLLAGEPDSIDRYLEQIKPQAQLDVGKLKNVADGVAMLAGARGTASAGSRYVQLTRKAGRSCQHMERCPIEPVPTICSFGGTGSSPATSDGSRLPCPAARAVSLQSAAMSAALRLAIQDVQSQVEEVARDVADLRRIAESAEVGNLAGRYRILANARDEADAHGSMSQATWDGIAPHEVTAQQAADRVRSLLRSTVEGLPLRADAGDRADAAQRLVDEGALRRSLRLLLLAEQCRLLWRSLKLDHVRKTEATALPGKVAAAERLLAENAAADHRLIELLEKSVTQLGSLHALDGLRLLSRRRLPALATQLRTDLDEFAELRKAQIESWVAAPSPTVKDAAKELGKLAGQAAIEARKFTGRRLEGWGAYCRENRRIGTSSLSPWQSAKSNATTKANAGPIRSDPQIGRPTPAPPSR